MKRILFACAALVALLCLAADGQSQIPSVPGVVNVNSPLMDSLGKALGGATPQQTTGAAGSIFGLAKSRLSPGDFSKVSNAVPGMDGMLQAAPPLDAPPSSKGLDSLNSSFTKLGLKPDTVSKAIPIVTQYVSKVGGKDVGKLLEGVLK